MVTHSEPQPVFASGLSKHPDNVLTRAHPDRIPAVMPGIPEIEVIVMHTPMLMKYFAPAFL
jgi:hypothetical protein